MPKKKENVKELLRKSMLDLETAGSARPEKDYEVATQEQLRELIEIALRQNKRIAERIDYLTEVLKEAVTPEEEPNQLLLALGKSQVEALEELENMKKKLEENEKILKKERAAIATERMKTLLEYEKTLKAVRTEQAKQLAELEKQISAVKEQLSKLPYGEQISRLLKKVEEIDEEVDILSEMISQDPEQVNARIAILKQEIDEFKREVRAQEKKTREEITKKVLEYVKKHAEETDKRIAKMQKEELVKLLSEQKKDVTLLQNKLEAIEKELKNYEEISSKEPEETAALIASLKQEIDDLKRRMQETEEKKSKALVSEFDEKLKELEKQLTAIQQENKSKPEQQALIKTLEKKIGEIDQNMKDYEELMSLEPEKTKYLISKLKEDLDRIYKKIETVDTKSNAEKINEIEAKVNTLSTRIEGIEKAVNDKVTENILKMKEEESEKIESVLAELSEIKKMLAALPKEAFTQGSDSDLVNKRINLLEQKVAEIEHPPSKETISNEIQKIKEKVVEDPEQKVLEVLSGMEKGEEILLSSLAEKTGLPQKEVEKIVSNFQGFRILETDDMMDALLGKRVKKL